MTINPVPSVTIASLLQESLAQGNTPALRIISNSMAPLLFRNDTILIETCSINDLQLGDIIVVTLPHTLMTHRYWGCTSQNDKSYLLTRGDRPLQFDPLVPESALLGRMIARQRNENHLSLQTKRGKRLHYWLIQLALIDGYWFATSLPTSMSPPLPTKIVRLLPKTLIKYLKFLLRRIMYNWARLIINYHQTLQRNQNTL